MKRTVLLMFVLSMVSLSFGDILIANFENDGLDYGFGGGTIVTGTGNTLGANSFQVNATAGWWNGTWELYIGGGSSAAKTALATVGTVKVDVTANQCRWLGQSGPDV